MKSPIVPNAHIQPQKKRPNNRVSGMIEIALINIGKDAWKEKLLFKNP